MTRLEDLATSAGRRFARFVTVVVTRLPILWPVFRGPLRLQFESLASKWDTLAPEDRLAPYEAALDSVSAPRRALDLGTGTGVGAFAIARRFPDAEVIGVDLSPAMLDEARRKTPLELERRIRFEVGDAARLRYDDGAFDLIGLANMIPFYDELARVTAPGGSVVLSFSRGHETPIYVPLERIRQELSSRGFTEFADFAAGHGTSLLARKRIEA